ncbi:MAG: hypothetical protein WC977_11500 [Anaerovoracaceae bacterium]|jgi:hypothetical protein
MTKRYGRYANVEAGTLKLGGTEVTSTAAELNILDGVTATAAELNILDTATVTAAELNTLDGAPMAAVFTVGAQASTTINVAIQLNDANGAALATRGAVMAYISDDANGDSIAATAPGGGWAIGTDGLLIPIVANKAAMLVSESDGAIDINVIESGTDDFYVIVILPNGKLVASGKLAFSAG